MLHNQKESKMKKTWNTPQLTVHGSVENLTQQRKKTTGGKDGIVLVLPNIDPIPLTDV